MLTINKMDTIVGQTNTSHSPGSSKVKTHFQALGPLIPTKITKEATPDSKQ